MPLEVSLAIVSIRIPDETFEIYKKMNPGVPTKAIEGQLERFKGVHINDRVLILTSEERKEIEKLRSGPLETAKDLIKWVRNLVTANVGGVEIPLKDGQRKKLEGEARFYKQDPKDYAEKTLRMVLDHALGGL